MIACQSTFSFRFGTAALAAVAALIAGCAGQSGIEGQAIDTESRPETKNLSVLMEADDRKQLTCTSMQPLSAQRALNVFLPRVRRAGDFNRDARCRLASGER